MLKSKLNPLLVAIAATTLIGCGQDATQQQQTKNEHQHAMVQQQENTLTQAWHERFEGVPNFDTMQLTDIEAAFEQAMIEYRNDIEIITSNTAPASFDNTIVALERAGALMDRVRVYYGIWSSNLSSPEFRAIRNTMVPKLSEFYSEINQNEVLFERVSAVYNSDEVATLTNAEQRLVKLVYSGFARNGATLDEAAKKRYAEINMELAELQTTFSSNVLHDEESYTVFLNKDQLGGLSDSFIATMATAADLLDKHGQYAIANTRSYMAPFLTYSTERELREQIWNNYYNRGDNGDQYDNNAIIKQILTLRDERVALLGYDNYAEWRLEDRMAKHPSNALDLMEAVWPAAIARAAEEVADMQAIADAEGADIKIAPWDYRFYAEKVRKAKYDLDSDEVKQYLQLENLTNAMHFVAGELFDFSFAEVTDGSVPVFHPDVRVWEVTNKTSGAHIGLWYLDPYARLGKRSGAWATSYRSHTTFDGKTNVLSANNSNFVKPAPGQPALVSWDDATTFFHEFGHALHTLASQVAYPTLNGGVRDYTEFQSQLLERWLLTQPVIDQFLVNVDTGQPISADLVQKIRNASTFNQGFATTEFLGSALMDMKYHTTDPSTIEPDTFERDELAKLGMPEEIVMRHRSTHFGHIFASEGYSAGYYGYMWADVLTSDASEAFAKAPGGFYDPEVAKRLVESLFEPRNSVDPADAYRAFRGRDAQISALMRDRGFPVPKS